MLPFSTLSRLVCLLLTLCLAIGLGLFVTPAQGQIGGSISGVVTDPTGALVPGANVALVDAKTHNARTTTTNEAGRYVFTSVDPGDYELSVTHSGFAIAKIRTTVDVSMVSTVNVSLLVGSSNEIVTVEARGVELQTTNATVGTTMNFDLAEALPGLSRDVSGLAMMQPATTPVSSTSGVAGSVAGSNADQNKYMLDGGNNSSDMDGTNTVYLSGFAGNPITGFGSAIPNGVVPTPVETIEEFRVGVAGQGGDFNSASGNQVNMVTRRGGDSWHGSAYEYYYGTNFSANSWVNGHTPSTNPATGAFRSFTPLPSRHENRFGVSAGGTILPKFLGGKTYLFGFYQGQRFPNVTTLEKPVPSDLMRAGVIQIPSGSAWIPFNLNPTPVTVNGVTYPSAVCGPSGNLPCDPRAIGLNPIVSQLWSLMPSGNDVSCAGQFPLGNTATTTTAGYPVCDQHNTVGYNSTISLPVRDTNWVFRLDHDFAKNWHFMSSYRYYKLTGGADTSQVDMGGILAGKKGQLTPLRTYPSYPGYFVAGLTTTISSRLTNDFRYNYSYNWWKWNGPGAPVQPITGLGGAVEIGGEDPNALIPYNVNTQQSRTRFWDGQDHLFRDDLSYLSGNHLFQFGGLYQRNFNWHDRNDNGQGIMAANVYQVSSTSGGISWGAYVPVGVPSGQTNNYQNLAAEVLGLVEQPQTLYTRNGADLHLLPLGTHAQDKSVIDFYSGYVADTWHMKPTFTLTYGLSYNLEMPPVEGQGRQVMLVDESDNPVQMSDYFAQRQKAALAGKIYDPVLGFATVGNVGHGRTYPYDPFYGGFGPRIAAAWNPRFDGGGLLTKLFGNSNTVIRGGYSRIYGRLNGVNLVLVPLLGTGLMQAVSCVGAVAPQFSSGGSQCLGQGGATPATAFRIGTDGLVAPLGNAPSNTLPQPYYPGLGGNLAAAPGAGLDPKTRPSSNDSFTLSVQRQVSSKVFLEGGYIGKLIHNEFQEINVDAVPWMLTLNGQSFANAYANVYTAICGLTAQTCPSTPVSTPAVQPWFEQALGGTGSPFCGNTSCTAAVIAKEHSFIGSNSVYQLWAALAQSSSWTLGLTNPGMNPPGGCPKVITPTTVCKQFTAFEFDASNGWGNYNAAYLSANFRDWHGITARSNFTWGRALGTGSEVQARSTRTVLNPFNLHSSYGTQQFDVKFIYNLAMNYKLPFYQSQTGILGRLLGGWSAAPVFTAQSGFPLRVTQTESRTTVQAFGQSDPSQTSIYNAVLINGKFSGGNSLHYSNTSPGSVGGSPTVNDGGSEQWINMFANPAAAYSQFRRLILGVDTNGGGFGILRGFPRWNVDMTFAKDIRATERVGVTFTALMTNFLNHFQPSDPSTMNLNNPSTFGKVTAAEYDARQVEFGLRVRF